MEQLLNNRGVYVKKRGYWDVPFPGGHIRPRVFINCLIAGQKVSRSDFRFWFAIPHTLPVMS